jgi:hypothetical protein
MFKVYWTYGEQSYGKEFPIMTEALDYCQDLRNSGRQFVTMCSELPDNATKMGVADVGPDYNWKKRRL